ncbi:MAG TPA: hypothetical protein VF291_05020, partial [Burkholderiaceae bacterium]
MDTKARLLGASRLANAHGVSPRAGTSVDAKARLLGASRLANARGVSPRAGTSVDTKARGTAP